MLREGNEAVKVSTSRVVRNDLAVCGFPSYSFPGDSC